MSMYREHSSLNRATYRGRFATCPLSGGSGLLPLHDNSHQMQHTSETETNFASEQHTAYTWLLLFMVLLLSVIC